MTSTMKAIQLEEQSYSALCKALAKKVSNTDWIRKAILYTLLGALAMRLARRKRSVKGKLVLVTGAAGGIGRELAMSFGRAGAKLALWDINQEALEKIAKDVHKDTGAEVRTYVCNLADKDAVYRSAEEVREAQGMVWCLVNNAGIISGQELLETPDSRIELSMKVNSLAYFWTTKAFLGDMLKNNDGHIVGVSSAAGLFPSPRMIDYCASKFAARGFMEALHTELDYLGKTGVKCTLVCPAHVNTELFKGYNMMGTMEPSWVANQILQAVQYGTFHLYLPSALSLGVVWQGILPTALWDFFMSFSYKSMKGWSPHQANQVFAKIDKAKS